METTYVHFKMKSKHRDYVNAQAAKLNLEKWEVISSLIEGGITTMAKAKPVKKVTKKVTKKK